MPQLHKHLNVTCHFMRRFMLTLFSFSICSFLFGQEYNFKASTEIVSKRMNKATKSGEGFIRRTIPDTIYQKHFQLSLPLSEVVNDTSTSYTVYFVDSIKFIPNKYELRYYITIDGDTLDDSYIIPIDSLGNTAIDTSNFHYIYDNLIAYKKLLCGQYKFDYKSVKQFIKAKKLQDCNIQLSNSMGRIYDKGYMKMKNHKHFWYVSFYRNDYEIIYRIDPDTGKYTLLKHRHQAVA